MYPSSVEGPLASLRASAVCGPHLWSRTARAHPASRSAVPATKAGAPADCEEPLGPAPKAPSACQLVRLYNPVQR